MKVAVIGVGNVGKTIFHDLQHVNMIREITLVDRNLDRAKAEIMDARDAFLASAETIRNAAISVGML